MGDQRADYRAFVNRQEADICQPLFNLNLCGAILHNANRARLLLCSAPSQLNPSALFCVLTLDGLQLAMNKIFLMVAIGILFAGCSSDEQTANTPVPATPLPQTEVKILPTPSSPGNSITWDSLQVTMDRLEMTQEYLTDFGSTRTPPAGSRFLWVHVHIKNTGQVEIDVPLAEHFSVLYATVELKPTYGHRAAYTDYTTLGSAIFPNQELDGWLRFDIPETAELEDLRFVFLPESSQVGASYNSPNYPYADDKPTYVWNCTP
jgi:hypothetical protein